MSDKKLSSFFDTEEDVCECGCEDCVGAIEEDEDESFCLCEEVDVNESIVDFVELISQVKNYEELEYLVSELFFVGADWGYRAALRNINEISAGMLLKNKYGE